MVFVWFFLFGFCFIIQLVPCFDCFCYFFLKCYGENNWENTGATDKGQNLGFIIIGEKKKVFFNFEMNTGDSLLAICF